MVERNSGGSIVNISSQASLRALKDHSIYCASKAALDSMTKAMSLELGKHNVCSAMLSGFVKSWLKRFLFIQEIIIFAYFPSAILTIYLAHVSTTSCEEERITFQVVITLSVPSKAS